jgi:hypothetical protein
MTEIEEYNLVPVQYCDSQMKTVTDFTTGDQRYRKWGMSMSISIMPGLDKLPARKAPVILPTTPSKFFAADDLDKLKEALVKEIDTVIKYAKMSVEDPEGYEKMVMEEYAKLKASVQSEADKS